MHDVLVVGAGPTGCYAARQLARLGYDVAVLEEHKQVGEPVHCTGIVSLETYQRFELDSRCVETRLASARFLSPSGQSFRVRAKQAKAAVVDRGRFDRALAREATAAGATFLLGVRADEIAIADDYVAVSGGRQEDPVSIRASLAIIATGTDEVLTRRIGLSETPGDPVFGAQLFAEPRQLDEVEVHIGASLAPGGFAWAVPANGHGCRVGLVATQQPRALLRRFAQRMEARGAIHCNGASIRCRTIPAGPRTPSYADRIMVVGDAAGQVKSTTSGGIYYGLLGADAAVRSADRALRLGDMSAGELAGYEADWLQRIGAEQHTGRMLRRVHATLRDSDFEALFWLVRRTGLARVLGRLSFDWHTAGLLNVLWRDLLGAATNGRRPPRF
jgi:geranylgeranyl reductase family protein